MPKPKQPIPLRPGLLRPGPVEPRARGRTALTVNVSRDHLLARVQIIVQGHVMGEAIMDAPTMERFIAACQLNLAKMKTGPRDPLGKAGIAVIKE